MSRKAKLASNVSVQLQLTSRPEDWISAFGRRHLQDCAPPEVVPVECSFVLGSSQQFTILPSVGVDHCDSITDHSTTSFPRRTDTSAGSSTHGMVRIATGLPIMGNHMSGAIHRMVATGRIPNHSQGTTSVHRHRRCCSVEHVLDARVVLLQSVVAMVLHVGRN